ncbi:MAG: flagellar basal body P-ring protein FlgI [Paracoccaceae bacterium]|nr:flagellar basal body P-ring protein FlgI [Marinovum sp.]MBT7908178.1 flagellar basal body P-ring protein FlgI [Marinovum sp.]MDG1424997.1 flagellar basal body P-ring protein FlgI [Paracoccaceae bacterium]
MAHKLFHTLLIIVFAFFSTAVSADRIKDLASLAGVRANQLVGYGLVVGLSGTGDKNLGITLQSMQAMLSRFGMSTDVAGLNGSNAAAVMVTAELGPFLKPGQTLDVTVSALGAAESLRGGTLLMTPLLGADGLTYAIAQGNLAVGGLGVQGEDDSSLTVNIPTVGRVPQGATVEKMVETPFLENEFLILNLHRSDFSTAAAVAEAIDTIFGDGIAVAIDGSSIRVRAPVDPSQRVAFVGLLESVEVEPAAPPAQVIVNSRTGTIIINGNVRVTPAAITHGSLTVRVTEDPKTEAQNTVVADGDNVIVAPTDPLVTPDTEITAEEETAKAFMFDPGVNLTDIVDAINAVGATPSDLVAILEALKVSGALRAQLIII